MGNKGGVNNKGWLPVHLRREGKEMMGCPVCANWHFFHDTFGHKLYYVLKQFWSRSR